MWKSHRDIGGSVCLRPYFTYFTPRNVSMQLITDHRWSTKTLSHQGSGSVGIIGIIVPRFTFRPPRFRPGFKQFMVRSYSLTVWYLVGGWATPLKNMNVNWDDDSQLNGKIKNGNQTTNQLLYDMFELLWSLVGASLTPPFSTIFQTWFQDLNSTATWDLLHTRLPCTTAWVPVQAPIMSPPHPVVWDSHESVVLLGRLMLKHQILGFWDIPFPDKLM